MEIKRISSDVDWDVFVTHPIELIKIDAALKLKTADLKTLLNNGKINHTIDGWSDSVEFELLKHLKMIAEFRTLLLMISRDMFYFNFPEFHRQEIETTWNQITQKRFEELTNNEVKITSFFEQDFSLFIKVVYDYQGTRKFFRDALLRVLMKMGLPHTHYIIETILRKVHFSLDTNSEIFPKFVMMSNRL